MDYGNYELSSKEKVAIFLLSLAGFGVTGYLFFNTLLPGLLGIAAYGKVKKVASKYLGDRRRASLEKEFKDCLYSFSTSFSSGRQMTEAMREAEKRLKEVYGSKSIMAVELDAMLLRAESLRERTADLWTDFGRRSAVEDIENFALVYRSIYESGGNLIEVVSKAADTISEKISIEGEIKAISSERRMEGRIIALMPLVILLFLKVSSPEYMSVMYSTAAGKIIMALGFVLILAGVRLIERITKIEI